MIKSNKGITIIAVIMTVIILSILSTIAIYTLKTTNNTSPYNKMIADIVLLEDKILLYYNENHEVPIQNYREIINEIEYNKIDLNKLNNITLYYGQEIEQGDYYLVNNSLEVYYKKGVEQGGTIYHTK